MGTELIDTHCHLEMSAFDSDRDEVIKRAAEENIKYIINIGSDREGNIKGLRVSEKYPTIFSAVGIHPHDAKRLDESLYNEIKDWIKKPKVLAVGEIGLDYHYLHSSKNAQIEAFRRQAAMAREAGLPIIVHSRDAKEDTIRVLREEASGIQGVLHCFSGDADMAETALKMGFYISIAGPVTFKNAKNLQKIAGMIPDERLLIETDAPYLSPVPLRGKRNEPSFIRHTAQKLAEIRGVTIFDIARITVLNAKKLFNIGEISGKGEIAYRIRDSLYLNITSRCTNRCGFCVRFQTSYVKGHNLRLQKEPSAEEIINAIENPQAYEEIVFCGLGEPFLRLDIIKSVAGWIKRSGGRVRVNTNGHGNVINGRNILPELEGIVDSLSISLDAEDEEKYQEICKPSVKDAFNSIKSFIRESKKYIPDVKITVVDIPEVNIEKCRDIARELGVEIRIRKFNIVG
jgi:TatD DNase family protein